MFKIRPVAIDTHPENTAFLPRTGSGYSISIPRSGAVRVMHGRPSCWHRVRHWRPWSN